MIEKFSCYEYQVRKYNTRKWVFAIAQDCYLLGIDWVESDDWFDSEQEAREGAIARIQELENPDPEPCYWRNDSATRGMQA